MLQKLIAKKSIIVLSMLFFWSSCDNQITPPDDPIITDPPAAVNGCQRDFSPMAYLEEGIFWEPENPEDYSDIAIVTAEQINKLSSWKDSPIFDDSIRMVLLIGGDYRPGERIELNTVASEFTKPKIIRSYDPDAPNPYRPSKEKQATIENVLLKGTKWTAWIDIQNRGQNKMLNAIGNFFIRNTVKDFEGYGYRLMNSIDNVWYQCDIGPGIPTGQDYAGIAFGAYRDEVTANNMIIDCHIFGVGDCIAFYRNVTKQYPDPSPQDQVGIAYGNVVAYNLLEVLPEQHTNGGKKSCSEEAIDLKSGILTDDLGEYNLIYKNTIIGTRPTDQSCGGSGSAGPGIVIHRNAKGWLIEENLFSDCAAGVTVFFGHNKYPDELVENIEITRNVFHSIKDYLDNPSVTGMALRLESDYVKAYDNIFIDVDTTIVTTNPKFEPEIGCNRRL